MNNTFTHDEIFLLVIIGLITLVLYLLKNTPLGFLWKIYKLFWIVLFATLLIDLFKKEVKEWLKD
jgi:energy-coupling factor transporter transmembrane protein EcfT